jgi:5-methylthioribose kinase
MIQPSGIARRLVRRKLLRSSEIVSNSLSIANVSRRNHVLTVTRKRGISYLIKQGVGPDRVRTLRRESHIYRALGTRRDLRLYLPRHYGYDRDHQLLILELLSGAQDLRRYHESRKRTPALIGRMLGDALATIHFLPSEDGQGKKDFQHLRNPVPGILRLHTPRVQDLRTLSTGSIELIKIVQRFGFRDHLERLRSSWRPISFIHGDLRWDNCLVPEHSPFPSRTPLRIVDWEFAGFGDPAWDIGFVFGEYLRFWVSNIPVTGESHPDRYLNLVDFPLERMQPALRSFWSSYRRRMSKKMRLEGVEAQKLLLRAVDYAAARLLHAAYEEMQGSAQLTGNAICLAQLSLNIFERPKEACVMLLGISS